MAVLLAEGRTLSDIAYASGRSTATIQSHLKRIFNKLGVGRQADVIRIILAVRAISKSP
ncbi:LuxR C-terminal-related transcriptional regulator [Candidatus Rariloculus sp.]|uniref:LuxR C-terminal-related transcriptional regulator n=1 Tax=Candidatus Rariloculus sp. TaxID=3101265 RepID=UPI003D12E3B2